MNGSPKPVLVDVGGIIFADGAGAFNVIAMLPLAPNYITSFLNFDVQKQKPQTKQLKVVGSETVTVPAGSFEAFKVDVIDTENEADKQTIWVAKDSHKVVKLVATLPSLGGAILTSELVP
jgi:transcription antitermination factor NusG